MLHRFLIATALSAAFIWPLSAEPTIQRYFKNLSEYQFTLLRETTTASEAGGSPFSPSTLQEASLLSFSTWQVDSAEGPRLHVEIVETGIGPGAFFLFTRHKAFQSESFLPLPGLEVQNRFNGEWGIFTVANYLISLRGASPLTADLFSAFSSAIDEALNVQKSLPASVAYLPETNLLRSSVRLYLSEASLSSNPRFPPALIPKIRFQDQFEVAYAEYGALPSPLFVIAYPTPVLASEYAVVFQDVLQGNFSPDGIYMKRSGPLISLFLGPKPLADVVLGEFTYDPVVEWIYEKKQRRDPGKIRTFLGLITRTLIGIGTFLLIIIACGTVVGLLRYEILRRFPILTTRKETIRLNLDRY